MIEKIEFENYRCYQKSQLKFKDLTVIVGKNNSGKSTIIEALRMVAMASKKVNSACYTYPPISLGIAANDKGFKIDVQKLKIDLRGIVYYYGDSIAKITTFFKNKTRIVIYLNTEIAFACVYDDKNNLIKNKSVAKKYNFDCLGILPQIGLIKENEKRLSSETITTDKDTYLSSRHFRNELLFYKKEFFKEFQRMAERTWSGLRILDLNYNVTQSEYLQLLIEDARFTAEIGLMGSGLQMWLQIIWFICRTKGYSTIILDEPDVYMHPDLQRKILNIVRNRYPQVIIATHSVEIISEVEPKNIVTVSKKSRQMKYANSSKAVQSIVDEIGGVQNLSLLRIGSAKKCLFVEGKDLKFISEFYNVIYPESEISLEMLPCVPLGGFTRLNEAFGASKLFYKETSGQIKCICILDRDYYPQNVIDDRLISAKESNLYLHVWSRKEIENYLLNPRVIFRITKQDEDKYEEFLVEFEEIIDTFKDSFFDNYSQQIANANKGKLSGSTCNQEARKFINDNWTTLENKIKFICGKEAIKKINKWIKEKYKQSCSTFKIIRCFEPEEIDKEIIGIINILIEN